MTDDELKAIEARLALPLAEPTTTSAQVAAELATEDILNTDVPALVAEVKRQAAELRAWREWVGDMFGARIDPDDPDTPNTDENLRSLASAIINE